MQKYQKKKDTFRQRAPFGESGDWRDFPRKRLRNAWEFPHGHCKSMSGEKRSPGSTWLSAWQRFTAVTSMRFSAPGGQAA